MEVFQDVVLELAERAVEELGRGGFYPMPLKHPLHCLLVPQVQHHLLQAVMVIVKVRVDP